MSSVAAAGLTGEPSVPPGAGSSPIGAPRDVGRELGREATRVEDLLRRHDRLQPQPARRHARQVFLGAVIGTAAMIVWLWTLAAERVLPIDLAPALDGRGLVIRDSPLPELQPYLGERLIGLRSADPARPWSVPVSTDSLRRSPLWLMDDAARAQKRRAQEQIGRAVSHPQVVLVLQADWPGAAGQAARRAADVARPPSADRIHELTISSQPRGLAELGIVPWITSIAALLQVLTIVSLAAARPHLPTLHYAMAALPVVPLLALLGAESMARLGDLQRFAGADLLLRPLLGAFSLGALVHGAFWHPRGDHALRPLARWWWAVMGLLALWVIAAEAMGRPAPALWWCLELATSVALLLVAWALRRGHRMGGPMLLLVQSRMTLGALATYVLAAVANIVASHSTPTAAQLAMVGTAAWFTFAASLLMVAPFLLRLRRSWREFVLLVGTVSLTASIDWTLVSLGVPLLPALAMSVGAALLAWLPSRRWIVERLAGAAAPSAAQMFDHLYRAARAIELAPHESTHRVAELLRLVFDPLAAGVIDAPQLTRAWAAADGSALLVPVPVFDGSGAATAGSSTAVVLHHARRGVRLFTDADRRLAERLLDQLVRAVTYERALEHGRSEERMRIAQDLHDDIGARLLTLMYQAPNEEVESYVRHTLQDLKTLTRGLAAPQHRLEDALGEWKGDLTQRLAAVHCRLDWRFEGDANPSLSVVQWSALTRILRELVHNVVTHARATRVSLDARLADGWLDIAIEDNGCGGDPADWKPGLGIGGVRKRARQMGGEVAWKPAGGGGVRCELHCPLGGVNAVLPGGPALMQMEG